jgi:hypothetical protein
MAIDFAYCLSTTTEVNNMITGIEWFYIGGLLLDLILIPIAAAAWKTYSNRVKDEELKNFIDMAVSSAEELKKSGQLGTSKSDYVDKMIRDKYPALHKNKPLIEALVHAAIKAAGLGSSSK